MAITIENLLNTAAGLPYANARCPGTFAFEFKDQKSTWVLELTKDNCRAYLNPVNQPVPERDCLLTYKTADLFLALHIRKDIDVRQQFLRGAIGVKGDLKSLGSIQGLLDEARVRIEAGVPAGLVTEVAASPTDRMKVAAPIAEPTPEKLYVKVLFSVVVQDQTTNMFGDLQDKRHVEYVLACSAAPFAEEGPIVHPPRILGQPEHRHGSRLRSVSCLPPGSWSLRHRFSDFLDLHKALKGCGPVKQSLPPKTFFGNPSPKVVKEREQKLESYLVGMLADGNAAQSKVLRKFLKCDEHLPATPAIATAHPVTAVPSLVINQADIPEVANQVESDASELQDTVDHLKTELAVLQQKRCEFERQSFNGFAILLLLLARTIHAVTLLGITVTAIYFTHFSLRHLFYLIYLGTEDDSCSPTAAPILFSAASWSSSLATPIFGHCATLGHMLQNLPYFAPFCALWSSLLSASCSLTSYLWPVAFILGLPAGLAMYSVLRRRIVVFTVAGIVLVSFKLVRSHASRLTSQDRDDLWEYVLRVYAIFMYRSILLLKGIWVKTGQHMSSRADVFPQPIVEEFEKLQDSVPPSPFPEIQHTVESSLKCKLSDLFDDFEEKALAAASIAQVHVAKLKDGKKVVVKVQHTGVRELMLEDLWSAWTIVRFVAWAEPDYDFRPIMQEWEKHVEMELDFACEVCNLKRAQQAMVNSGLDVVIPIPLEAYTATRVCVMEFCPGFKVTDAKALAQVPNKEEVMKMVCQSFAYQMHIDGLFNADPHPGNILLQVDAPTSSGQVAVRPVILDWGLAKTLDDHRRLAFAKFVYSAFDKDFVGMLQAFELMGVKLNREDPMVDMANIRFMFRDTAPPEEATAEFMEQAKKWEDQHVQHQKKTGRKSPMDAFPGDVLFFLRATEMLQGLGSRLRVRTPYLQIMSPYARQALVEQYPAPKAIIYPTPVLSLLEQNVRSLLKDLFDKDALVGCQVCVYKDGQKVVDTAAGWRGPVDRRPCTPDMVFCGPKLSFAAVATAVHLLADRGILSYDDPVSRHWKAFANKGKAGITVRQLLTHQAWLQHAIPTDFSMQSMVRHEAIMAAIEDTEPLPGTQGLTIYHPFGTWMLVGLVEKCTKQSVAQFLQQEVAASLDIEKEFCLGLPSDFPQELVSELRFELPADFGAGGGGQDGIGDMLSVGEKSQNPEDILAEDSDEGHVLRALFKKLRGKEYLLDPRLANYKQLQGCPTNGFFSARALAKFLDTLPYVLAPGRLREIGTVYGSDESLLQQLFGDDKTAKWGLGFQLFGFRQADTNPTEYKVIGHWGGGGSLIFTSPSHRLSFAMTTNKLSKDLTATEAVAQLVCNHFGLGDLVFE